VTKQDGDSSPSDDDAGKAIAAEKASAENDSDGDDDAASAVAAAKAKIHVNHDETITAEVRAAKRASLDRDDLIRTLITDQLMRDAIVKDN